MQVAKTVLMHGKEMNANKDYSMIIMEKYYKI